MKKEVSKKKKKQYYLNFKTNKEVYDKVKEMAFINNVGLGIMTTALLEVATKDYECKFLK